MESDKTIIAESEVKTQSSTRLVQNLEKLTAVISKVVEDTNEPFAAFGANTALVVKYEPPKQITLVASEHRLITNETEIDIDYLDGSNSNSHNAKSEQALAQATIPAAAFGNTSKPVTSLLYRENTLLQEVDAQGQPSKSRLVSSSVLSISVGDEPVTNLLVPLVLRFQRSQSTAGITGDDLCSFWNFTAREYLFINKYLLYKVFFLELFKIRLLPLYCTTIQPEYNSNYMNFI